VDSIGEGSEGAVCDVQTPAKNAESSPGPGWVALSIPTTLAEAERVLILRTMEATGGNRTQAAKILGISVRTLYSRLLKYGQQ
jgi:DNA-binding NtrC family response regulator